MAPRMTKPITVTENELIEAMRDAIPLAPPAPWMTLHELMAALSLTEAQAHRRIGVLEQQGKLERQRAPNRGNKGGQSIYYLLKIGKA